MRIERGIETPCVKVCQIDPKERTVAIVLFQHLPFNEGEILSYYTNSYYSALAD